MLGVVSRGGLYFFRGVKEHDVKPTSVRFERPLYEALNGLSQAADLPVGKLLRQAVVEYIGRLEAGQTRLPRLGEASLNKDEVGTVIKKYREASRTRRRAEESVASDALAERLLAIESRLGRLERLEKERMAARK